MKYTLEEIKTYIRSQDSLGDVLWNLTDEKIQKANSPDEILRREFLESDLDESESIQLDNLDWAKLIRDHSQNTVYVENEHGSTFDLYELSEEEINLFRDIL